MELTFCCLRAKEVVNICDGKRLGCITDIVFDSCLGRITGIVVPCERNFWGFFKSNNDLFIPYHHICKIGKDVILVQLSGVSPDCCHSTTNILETNNQKNNSENIDTNLPQNNSTNNFDINNKINLL